MIKQYAQAGVWLVAAKGVIIGAVSMRIIAATAFDSWASRASIGGAASVSICLVSGFHQ